MRNSRNIPAKVCVPNRAGNSRRIMMAPRQGGPVNKATEPKDLLSQSHR
jgi:hypothetical protein